MSEDASPEPSPDPGQHVGDGHLEEWREGLTMALYVSLSLLAVILAVPTPQDDERTRLTLTIVLTSVGLVLAHQVAFRMSARLLAPGGRLDGHANRSVQAQLVGGAAVTALAALPVLLLGADALWLSVVLLLVFVLGVGYLVARSAGRGVARSLLYVLAIGVVVVGVLVVKSLVGH